MKTTKHLLTFVLFAALVGSMGCSTLHKSDTARLQGSWKGPEIGGRATGPCYLSISGNTMEFRGADPREWYKATFSLREDTDPKQVVASITECPFSRYVGKTSYALYRFEDGTLIFAGNEPGSAEPPSGFDAAGTRRFELKKQRAYSGAER